MCNTEVGALRSSDQRQSATKKVRSFDDEDELIDIGVAERHDNLLDVRPMQDSID